YSRRIKPAPNSVLSLQDIRNFYIEDYFIETEEAFSNRYKHKITGYLKKIGGISLGKGQYNYLYSIPNDFKTFFGDTPADLFYPIQRYINGLFLTTIIEFQPSKLSARLLSVRHNSDCRSRHS
ncbi:hypothetical protein, partial [Sphingobacterium multivorum]|uniref:hypothetical protein n=1 Tax=Sphingobacterium multivorum TaxID=28454 RepID=UPI00289B282D